MKGGGGRGWMGWVHIWDSMDKCVVSVNVRVDRDNGLGWRCVCGKYDCDCSIGSHSIVTCVWEYGL